MSDTPKTTSFGYRQVAEERKADLVRGVFDSVADRYDLMNDLMSGGVHRAWKAFAVAQAQLRPGHRVLDLAGGTGDLSSQMAPRVGSGGMVVLADINEAMVARGRDRMADAGLAGAVQVVLADAEALPFPDNHFHCVTIAFGLRNVTRKQQALEAMYRVLKPGGRLLVLEFSHPVVPGLKPAYDVYSFGLLPLLGDLVAQDRDSYRYLAESIRMHPPQEELLQMIADAGFEQCGYHNLTGGIVALHKGFKF